MRNFNFFVFCIFFLCCFMSCNRVKAGEKSGGIDGNVSDNGNDTGRLAAVFTAAEIPDEVSRPILASPAVTAFTRDLRRCLDGDDPYLRLLVDKQHPLPAAYEPDDLVELGAVPEQRSYSYLVNRAGLMLRKAAAASLEEMAAAARADGVTLVASSTYRSYGYQEQVYNRNVREMGQAAADRESAPPGRSQHQTGLVVDFGSIDDSFAQTAAGRWIAANASRFGWSLSFPDGYERLTGYRWESWHYRYVGKELAAFTDNYFGGIQQYALRFIREYSSVPH